MKNRIPVIALAGVAMAAAPAAAADFYAGKTIEIDVGSPPGGGYNAYARSVSRYIGNHIPGHPTVIVKNMPGAGGRKVTAWTYNAAPKDGSAITASQPGSLAEPILGNPQSVKYDPRKFGYIGSTEAWVSVCAARKDAAAKTFKEAFEKQILVGGDVRGSSLHDTPTVLKNVLGVKFKIIKGYPGSRDVVNAIERNEVQGICGYAWTSLQSQAGFLLKENKINILVQTALDPDPELAKMGVPMVWDFVKTKEQHDILELIFAQQSFGRPYFVPPGVPKERLAILRTAFDETMKDPAFIAELTKQHLGLSPKTGVQVQQMIEKMFNTPKDIQAKAKEALTKE
jgi:tripartite-type tricarboxylate transporter receptor subunit TctC